MSNAHPVRMIVLGAGLVGERHARLVASQDDCELVAIVDPSPERASLADELGCDFFESLEAVPAARCDAAIIATPNASHLPLGLECAARGWGCLIEKPIAETVEAGIQLADAFEAKGLPLLVGHHRRYHPFVSAAAELIRSRELGEPVIASMIWAVRKPDSYFRQGAWRTGADGGPLLINLIHELDLMHHIFGPVRDVQAVSSNRRRGGAVEDTAAVIFTFESGMVATVTLSDAALTPWSFEGATAENPNIAFTGISSWRIGCTQGAFEFPGMTVWRNHDQSVGDWSKPLKQSSMTFPTVNPLSEQLSHFASLVRGDVATPVVSGRDGIAAMQILDAIQASIRTGQIVTVPNRTTVSASQLTRQVETA